MRLAITVRILLAIAMMAAWAMAAEVPQYEAMGARRTSLCRKCLDHFWNTYYCSSTVQTKGACCPFPKVGASVDK